MVVWTHGFEPTIDYSKPKLVTLFSRLRERSIDTYEETNRPLSRVIKANNFYLSRLVYVWSWRYFNVKINVVKKFAFQAIRRQAGLANCLGVLEQLHLVSLKPIRLKQVANVWLLKLALRCTNPLLEKNINVSFLSIRSFAPAAWKSSNLQLSLKRCIFIVVCYY